MTPRGFTLIEVVLAMALLATLLVIGVQAEFTFQTVLAGHGARQVESVLQTAAERARSGVSGTNWGAYFVYDETTRVATKVTIFSGTSYLSRDASKDVDFPLGRGLKLMNVSLSGAVPSIGNDHEIVFSQLSGVTSQYGSITIQSYASSTQIDISSVGIPVTH